MLALSARLHTIAAQVPQGARFADIGSDHAFLPIYLVKSGRIPFAIASDINEGPLARGRAVAAAQRVKPEQISFRLSDGLRAISAEEVDTVAIAGMGGDTIAQCLGGVPWSRAGGHLFLLQAMSSVMELRLWLSQNGFTIEEEQLTTDQGRRYNSMRVRAGEMPLTQAQCWVGRQWEGLIQPQRLHYLEDNIARRSRALAGLQSAQRADLADEIHALTQVIEDLNKMRKEWIAWQR